MTNETAYNVFVRDFSNTICKLTKGNVYSNVIFLCIGTDRIIGDSFGPIVGHRLNKIYRNIKNIDVIGDLNNIVCDTNIVCTMRLIERAYKNPFIISIDAALSKDENIGRVIVQESGILLGKRSRKSKACCR